MSAWLISVAGISLLTIICDAVLPDGNTKKYVRTVIGIVVSLVMVSPVLTFFGNFSIATFEQNNQIETQQQYLDSVQAKKFQSQQQQITTLLDQLDISNYTLEISGENSFILQVDCDKTLYQKVCQALEGITKNITIVWSNGDG